VSAYCTWATIRTGAVVPVRPIGEVIRTIGGAGAVAGDWAATAV
jgi:hypothetical protein